MASYSSGSIYFSGLGSGTDFSSVVEKLKKIEEIPKTQLQNWQSDWQKRYDAFGEIISAVREAKNTLSGLNTPMKFLKKIATSNDEKVLKATANANAVDGDHTIDVKKLASNAIWALNQKYDAKDTVINDSGAPQTFSYTYKGKRRDVNVPANTTVEGLATLINNDPQNPGVKMSLIHNGDGYTFQIQGKESGKNASLVVFPSPNLKGFGNENVTWKSDGISNAGSPFDSSAEQKSCQYRVLLDNDNDGVPESSRIFTIAGNKSLQDLADAINAGVGAGTATVNGKKLTLGGSAVGMQVATANPPSPYTYSDFKDVSGAGTTTYGTYGLNSGTTDATVIAPSGATFTATLSSGETRTITLAAGATLGDLRTQLKSLPGVDAQISQDAATGDDKLYLTGIQKLETTDPANFPGASTGSTLTAESTEWGREAIVTTTVQGTGVKPTDTFAAETVFQVRKADGNTATIVMAAGKTWQDLATALQSEGVKLDFKKISTSPEAYDLELTGAMDLTKKNATTGAYEQLSNVAGIPASYNTAWSSAAAFDSADTLDPTAVPDKLKYTFTMKDGTSYDVTVNSNQTMVEVVEALRAKITTATGTAPASLQWLDASGNALTVSPDGKTLMQGGAPYTGEAFLQMDDLKQAEGRNLSGKIVSSSLWSIQESRNAEFTVDNWPQIMESSSNTVTDVIEGLTLTFLKKGEARVSIAADTSSVKENIQTVLDAINTVTSKIQELTKFDEDKQQGSYDPEDDNYSSSQWDQEKGSVLTGNYGVQLLNSRLKSLVSSPPPGFKSRQGDDVLSGDYLAALSQIGIKTCTEEGNPSYGLLMVAPPSGNAEMQALDQKRFDDALANHMDDVINLFSADSMGYASSEDFRYANHLKGTTKAGNYAVEYNVDNFGNITDVTINGVPANADSSMGSHWYSAGTNAGDATGLAIQIDNLTPGNHKGTVSIKQGKIGEMEDFFTDELKYSKYTPEENGALMILQTNYKGIMENIQAKIDRETERIAQWEKREKAKFARLETLLGQYNQQQTALTSQLGQLSSGSSS